MQKQKGKVSLKPILFNTEMVRAILDGSKSVTRRVVKPQPETDDDIIYKNQKCEKWFISPDNNCFPETEVKPPCYPGDILYVRETWAFDTGNPGDEDGTGYFAYKADVEKSPTGHWHPSTHMPEEAARIFLRVTNVKVEKLQKISIEEVRAEGVKRKPGGCKCAWRTEGCKEKPCPNRDAFEDLQWRYPFSILWDKSIRKADRPRYGWAADPWVWVIGFEQISNEEAMKSES